MSGGTKRLEGQNIEDIEIKKSPEGQSVRRRNILLAYFQYIHIKNINNNTLLYFFQVYHSTYMQKKLLSQYNSLKKNGN
jgi:hypothetical protein